MENLNMTFQELYAIINAVRIEEEKKRDEFMKREDYDNAIIHAHAAVVLGTAIQGVINKMDEQGRKWQ